MKEPRMQPEPDEPLYDAEQMMRLLNLRTKKTLYTLVARGQAPPCVRVGRSLRFPPRDFRQWLNDRKD